MTALPDPALTQQLLARRDPEWLRAQYDNRARVPGALDTLARWASDSAAAREALQAQGRARLGLAYGPDASDKIDVFLPHPAASEDEAEHAEAAPVLVYLHGGWWRSLGREDFSLVAPAFTRAGALVMVVDYALCPTVTVEAISLQVTRALAWAWQHAEDFGGDRDRLVVAGHSAGAHLAAMACSADWRQVGQDLGLKLPQRLLRRALAFSGVYDLDPLRHTAFLQADLRLDEAASARLSPLRWPAPAGVQLHLAAGGLESESFLAQSAALQQAWGPRAVPTCAALDGLDHFSIVDDFAQPGGHLHGLTWELLDGA